ncbi:pyrroloquinoline quinone biosynthesis peptide chaperone PqqD [Streptomyces sp. NPDC017979]|uniref:pyrroloquinoline quinone biosynthesis peptide chaperone PqqD n=1 Tax=Streptomyces sp. NPDC017979 TaxID=3365024 RepID=UPI0037BC73BF
MNAGQRPAPSAAPAPPAGDWQPALARSVLLRYDRVRAVDLLVMPERVVVLTGNAGTILRLCDGSRRVDDIVAELRGRHPGAPVAVEVPAFLARVRAEGWLT